MTPAFAKAPAGTSLSATARRKRGRKGDGERGRLRDE